jgi:hypothetical protein
MCSALIALMLGTSPAADEPPSIVARNQSGPVMILQHGDLDKAATKAAGGIISGFNSKWITPD